MIRLDVKSELPRGVKWTNEFTKQLPYSAANALNASIQGSKFIAGSKQKSALNALAGSSRRYLDRPKKATQTGFRATRANKSNLSTYVVPKDRLWSRSRYLSGNILGGQRAPKDWETALISQSNSTIPKGSLLIPTRYWNNKTKDRYGNISKANINKLFNSGTTGRTATGNIFVGTPRGGGRPPGVYRRERNYVLRPLFYADTLSSISYDDVFPAGQVIQQSAQKTFGIYLRHELLKNVRKRVKEGKADLGRGFF